MEYINSLPIVERHEQVRWHTISNDQLERYKSRLDYLLLLDNVNIPPDLLDCCEYESDAHQCVIEELHNDIVNACLQAGHLMLPHRSDQSRATPVIGWNEQVAESKAKAVLWHRIWQDRGSPNQGVVYDIRKSTHATYHYAIRHAKKQTNVSQANKLADASLKSLGKRSRDFGTKVKRIKGKSQQRPVMVDGCYLMQI